MRLSTLGLAVASIAHILGCSGSFGTAKVDTTALTIQQVDKRVQLYVLKKGMPPTGEGLRGVFGDEPVPTDSWGNELVLVAPGPNGSQFDVLSYGSDGTEGGTGAAADIRLSELP